MLIWSVVCLLAAMGLGALLLARGRAGWSIRLAHGGAGALGLSLALLAVSRGLVRGAVAIDAAGLLAAGLALGLPLAWRRRPPPGLWVFLHATLGGLGALLLVGLALG